MTEEKEAPEICIREEQGKDALAVHELLLGSFEGNIEAEIVHHIRKDCGRCLSLVATGEERIVGYVLFSLVTI